jgi:hypothetical protein
VGYWIFDVSNEWIFSLIYYIFDVKDPRVLLEASTGFYLFIVLRIVFFYPKVLLFEQHDR